MSEMVEQFYREFIDRFSDAYYRADKEGRVIQLLGWREDLLGLREDEVLGKLIKDMVPNPDEHQRFLDVLHQNKGLLKNHEVALRHKDGHVVWLSTNSRIYRDDEGNALGVEGVVRDISERKFTEAELSGFFNLSRDIMCIVSEEGDIRRCNPAIEQAVGQKQIKLIGKPLWQFCHPDDQQSIKEFLQALDNSGNEAEFDARLKTAQGDFKWYSMRCIHNPDEKVIYLAGTDIEEKREAEKILQEGHDQFLSLLDTLPVWVSLKDKEFRYMFGNRKTLEDLGLDQNAYWERYIMDLAAGTPGEKEALLAMDNKILNEGLDRLEETLDFTYNNGETHAMRHIKVPYKNRDGEVLGIVTTSMDLNPLKEKEEALRRSEERYSSIINMAGEAIVTTNAQGNIVQFNKGAETVFGYGQGEAMGQPVEMLFHTENQEFLPQLPGNDSSSPVTVQATVDRQQVIGLRKNGETFEAEASLTTHQTGEQWLTSLVLRDVSERNQMEAELRQAQKMEAVGQLAGGVAHAFNNLLQVIHGYGELASRFADHPAKTREYLKKVIHTAENASSLSRQMLTLSRKQMLNKQVTDLNVLIADHGGMLRNLIGELYTVDLKLEAKNSTVHLDKVGFEQVILNLAVNARDAMPDGGNLMIKTKNCKSRAQFCRLGERTCKGECVVVSVSDTGSGMSPEVLAQLFDPFFTTKDPDKGTGLGLSTVYGLIQQHDGVTTVSSEPGKGSTFDIYLPVYQGAEKEDARKIEINAPGGTETILVAEDQAEVRALLEELLRVKGYKVIIANDGQEAVDIMQKRGGEVDLVIMDVVMPRMDGMKAYQHIKKDHPHIPVIFSTGFTGDQVEAGYINDHQLPLIYKPYTPPKLYQLIRTQLSSNKG